MSNNVWLTRWRKEPVIPDNYEDLPSLLRLAKRLRNEIIEFDWVFNKEEIIKLRRAVFEVGSLMVKRYKCFYSRVLAAINSALDKEERLFELAEPKGYEQFDCQVRCSREGNIFHLQGHATFDLIFALAQGGAVSNSVENSFLDEHIKEKLVENMRALGWDTKVLIDSRYDAFRTKLYGMQPKNARTFEERSDTRPELQLDIHFKGPFSAFDNIPGCRCLFKEDVSNNNGVYIWTVNANGHEIPYYIGQTRRGFNQRIAEHIRSMLSGEYLPLDAVAISQGKYKRAEGAPEGFWPHNLPGFLINWEKLIPNIIHEIKLFRFYLAPINVPDGWDIKLPDLLNRVEGAIGWYLKRHTDKQVREFFAPGIKLPILIPGDRRLRIRISSEVPIEGLPLEILD